MIASRRWGPEPSSVPLARRFVLDTVGALPRRTLDTLVLMVSELATNCVLHARSEFRISVDCTERCVRVEVTDTGAGTAHLRTPSTTDAHGRGLRIVSALADEWGIDSAARDAGKTVWFEVHLSAAD